jgi:hypothetical protein
MKQEFDDIYVSEAVDAGEYDYEGDMAKTQLVTIADAAEELHDMLEDDENLPEWCQNKITKAMDYLDTVRDYMIAKDTDEEPGDENPNEAVVNEGNMASAAKELEAYARKSGGIDKNDFIKAAMMMKRNQKKQLDKFVDELDTEPREKIQSVMQKHIKEAKLSDAEKSELEDLILGLKIYSDPYSMNPQYKYVKPTLDKIKKKFGDKIYNDLKKAVDSGNWHSPKYGMARGTYGADRLAWKKPTTIKKDGKIDARSAKSTKRSIKYNLKSTPKDPKRLGEENTNASVKIELDEKIQSVMQKHIKEAYSEPQGQAKRMMSPLQKIRMDKEKKDRDKDGKLKSTAVRRGKSTMNRLRDIQNKSNVMALKSSKEQVEEGGMKRIAQAQGGTKSDRSDAAVNKGGLQTFKKKPTNEKLKVSDGMGAWIDDFKQSDAPQFKGKTAKERRDMAIAAYLSAKDGGKNEDV